MILNRLKPQNIPFEGEHFYIYQTTNGVCQLRDSSTHMAISTSTDLEGLKKTFKSILGRYKTYNVYRKAMDNLSEPGITPRVAKRREEEYRLEGDKYKDIVDSIVRDFTSPKAILHRPSIEVKPQQPPQTQDIPSPRKSLLKRRSRLV